MTRRRVIGVVCVLVVLAAVGIAKPQAAEPELKPGSETRLELPGLGIGGDHVLLYLPTDYTADRDWPVIFCYHGQGGKPTTWPFRQLTGGKGAIVVGLEYIDPKIGRVTIEEYKKYVLKESIAAGKLAKELDTRVKIDEKRMIIGGFSMGGWFGGSIGEASPERWCGIAILGAGRHLGDRPLLKPVQMKGKAVYIGVGEKDPNHEHGVRSAEFLTAQGADVTLEEYPGLGHEMKMDAEGMKKWIAARIE